MARIDAGQRSGDRIAGSTPQLSNCDFRKMLFRLLCFIDEEADQGAVNRSILFGLSGFSFLTVVLEWPDSSLEGLVGTLPTGFVFKESNEVPGKSSTSGLSF